METKVCRICGEEKELYKYSDKYNRRKSGYIILGKRNECRECANKVRRKYYLKDYRTGLLSNARQRSRISNIECTLTKEDIIIPTHCPILKVPLVRGIKGNYKYSPTIDRLDNTKGYIKGNIKVISMQANKMKNNATFKELKAFSENILNYFNDDIV